MKYTKTMGPVGYTQEQRKKQDTVRSLTSIAAEMEKKGLGKPKVHLSFTLDSSFALTQRPLDQNSHTFSLSLALLSHAFDESLVMAPGTCSGAR